MFVKALIIASIALCGVASADLSPSKSCNGLPAPRNLYIENCEFFPCPIYTGYNVNAQWDFLATTEISQINTTAKFAIFEPLYIPYQLGIKNGCANLVGNTQCPLKPNDVGTFMLSFPVPSVAVPGIKVWIQFSLADKYGDVQSCFKVQFIVKKGH